VLCKAGKEQKTRKKKEREWMRGKRKKGKALKERPWALSSSLEAGILP
jgi:hypothetical protein